ncbi:MAG: class I SAM-dependent methyltransferase [Lachnospiraceae bacterium]|nr:class I SAM-dependent methyltransferase [Lachnospiraceae bacterium]
MTDFDKVRNYYRYFDEQNRLTNSNSGRLEFEITMEVLHQFLPGEGKILDLGGGAGAYSFPLADEGYSVYLADLSDELINKAKEYGKDKKRPPVSYDVVNATDLNTYDDEQFDALILFGPLYHLLESSERLQCISEVKRVLKKSAPVFASFIPRLSGSIALIDRYFNHPDQVNAESLKESFQSGKFNNMADTGFQEGFYPSIDEIEELFSSNGFEKKLIRSLRGFGYEKEDSLYRLEKEDREMFDMTMRLLNETSQDRAIVEMCGHAIYVGRKA